MIVLDGKVPIKSWVDGFTLEEEAKKQLYNIASMPFVYPHVAVMPDVHWGMGATVGSVIPTQGAIIPAAVGVDIGCGMQAVKLNFDINDIKDLAILRNNIEKVIPVGTNQHIEPVANVNDIDKLRIDIPKHFFFNDFRFSKSMLQLGSLGGGNHFIEVSYDQNNSAWIVLHSGSRNIGKTLADVYINKAKGLCKQYFIELPDPDLAYLAQGTSEFEEYIGALLWAQKYAKINRVTMMDRVLKVIYLHVFNDIAPGGLMTIDCHHNYSKIENHFGKNLWITRKGAVSARVGELGIIPGSMGTRSYIVTGKGNNLSFCSCSHGAGRSMSRSQAKKTFTIEDHLLATQGVECRKSADIIDETPGAYKDIDLVMNAQKDLVDILYTLKQVLCVKG